MANDEVKRIKKIKLSDGQVYYLYDEAAHSEIDECVKKSGGTMTGDLTIDAILKANSLYVMEIDDISTAVENVLTEDTTTHEIKRRAADSLLEDIGGISYSMDAETGTLSLIFGRQPCE